MRDNNRPPKISKPSPRLRALFREIARDIIAKDRQARKHGWSQNTIGEIERAIVKGFMLGQEGLLDVRQDAQTPSAIDWLDVPPRSRDTLMYMTFAFSQRNGTANMRSVHEVKADQIEVSEESGRMRWCVVRGDVRNDHTFANGSVAPLLRLELIRPLPHNLSRYELTEAGVQLCKDYWRRSDADDPTLPRQSMR